MYKTVSMKRERAKHLKLSYNCLRSNHSVKSCSNPGNRKVCKRCHHIPLCVTITIGVTRIILPTGGLLIVMVLELWLWWAIVLLTYLILAIFYLLFAYFLTMRADATVIQHCLIPVYRIMQSNAYHSKYASHSNHSYSKLQSVVSAKLEKATVST